jgi:hypothetical protein
MFHPAYLVSRPEGGEPVFRVAKRPAFFEGRFQIEAIMSAPREWVDVAVVSIVMMVLLERMRG